MPNKPTTDSFSLESRHANAQNTLSADRFAKGWHAYFGALLLAVAARRPVVLFLLLATSGTALVIVLSLVSLPQGTEPDTLSQVLEDLANWFVVSCLH